MSQIYLQSLKLSSTAVELPVIIDSLNLTALPTELIAKLKDLFTKLDQENPGKLFDLLMRCHYSKEHPEYELYKSALIQFDVLLKEEVQNFDDQSLNLFDVENQINHALLKNLKVKFSDLVQTLTFSHTVFTTALQKRPQGHVSVFKRLIGETYDDDVGLLESYGSVMYAVDNDTLEDSAFFVMIEGYTSNTDLQFAHDSMAQAFSYLEDIQTNFGKVALVNFYEHITSDEIIYRNNFYYTADIKSSKPLDTLLLKYFGVTRLINLARTAFGEGWEIAIAEHPTNRRFNLIDENEINQMKEMKIPKGTHAQIIERLCHHQIMAMKEYQIERSFT